MTEPKIIVGLEIHAYIHLERIPTKLFCNCPNTYQEAEPNTNICPVCTAQPGSKPMLPNEEAVDKVLAIALMLGSEIPSEIRLQRKHYDYPDLPSGYQRTVSGSYSSFVGVKGEYNGVQFWEVHLEEDAAKYDPKTGRVDYNRAGMPLIEMVTAPTETTIEGVRQWLHSFITLLEYIQAIHKDVGIKADVNVNIPGHARVEVKNVNSLWSIYKAIEHEVARQKQVLAEGKETKAETRAFIEETQSTEHMRYKESAADYRFIPEPDLPIIQITKERLEKIKRSLPERPIDKAARWIKQWKINPKDAEIISSNLKLAEIFEELSKKVKPETAVRWCRHEILKHLIDENERLLQIKPLLAVIERAEKKEITDLIAKDILKKYFEEEIDVETYLKQKNVTTISGTKELEAICQQVIQENQKAVEDYKNGEEKSFNFLVGQVMRKTKKAASPDVVRECMKKVLKR